MKINVPEDFLAWFEKTNYHLFEGDSPLSANEYKKEVTEYISDVLIEHMETLESDLDILMDDDSPDSGFFDDEGDLQ
tara:strand:- start:850 stop:1080 length:231 start_codon:yes stop_codon:yes gene_type:complete